MPQIECEDASQSADGLHKFGPAQRCTALMLLSSCLVERGFGASCYRCSSAVVRCVNVVWLVERLFWGDHLRIVRGHEPSPGTANPRAMCFNSQSAPY
eukprot:364782-Chlamydomonas_euryale.AAC.18